MSDAAMPGHARPPRPLVERFVVRVIWIVLAIVAIAILWQGAIEAFKPPAYLIPTPFGVLHAFSEKQETLVHHASYTFSSALLGLAVSSVFAISLAVLFVSFRMFAQASMPLVIAFRSMPAAAKLPALVNTGAPSAAAMQGCKAVSSRLMSLSESHRSTAGDIFQGQFKEESKCTREFNSSLLAMARTSPAFRMFGSSTKCAPCPAKAKRPMA